MENEVNVNEINNGSMTQLDPAYGGELMPVNQENNDGQPSTLEMVSSIAVVAIGGYLVGKLGELAWNKLLLPGYIKAVEKINGMKKDKDERVSRRKNGEIVEGTEPLKDPEPDENQEEEQPLPKKGGVVINGMRKEKRKR